MTKPIVLTDEEREALAYVVCLLELQAESLVIVPKLHRKALAVASRIESLLARSSGEGETKEQAEEFLRLAEVEAARFGIHHTKQQEAEPLSHANPGELSSPLVFIDGLGAARKSPEECRDGVSYIQHGGRTYWPLSDQDNHRLLRACCGHGEFDGPHPPAAQPQVPDVDEIYKRFCEWCSLHEAYDLDPRLHTHSGNRVSAGAYISNRVTSIAFLAFRDGMLSAAKEES